MGFSSVYILIFFELAIVAFYDYRFKKIANLWSLFNIVLFTALLFALPNLYAFTWSALFFPIVFFIITFILYVLKIMGAGDSKFLFTFYLLVPEKFQEDVFLFQAYLTVLVGGSLLLYNTLKNFDKLKLAYFHSDISLIRNVYGKKFAYAPVIFGAWIWFGAYAYIYKNL